MFGNIKYLYDYNNNNYGIINVKELAPWLCITLKRQVAQRKTCEVRCGTNSKSGQTNLPALNKSDIDGRCDLLVRYDSLDQ